MWTAPRRVSLKDARVRNPTLGHNDQLQMADSISLLHLWEYTVFHLNYGLS